MVTRRRLAATIDADADTAVVLTITMAWLTETLPVGAK
jgi:hypothetical protein